MTATKILLIVGASLVLLGLAVAVIGLAIIGFDFSKLDTAKYTHGTALPEGEFNSINASTDRVDIIILPSPDGKVRIEYTLAEGRDFRAEVSNGSLNIVSDYGRPWYQHVWDQFKFENEKITLYLPEGGYNFLNIETVSGDINVSGAYRFERAKLSATSGDVKASGLDVGDFEINGTSGDVELCNLAAKSLFCETTTGDISLTDANLNALTLSLTTGDVGVVRTVVSGQMAITVNTGDIDIVRSDAASLIINCGTGDVKASLLSPKTFNAKSTTGDIKLPDGGVGGICKITTTTGDILVEIVD